MDTLFIASKALTQLVLPPTGFLLLAIVGLLTLKRWPRIARGALWASVVCLAILSLPVTASALRNLLSVPPLDAQAAQSAQAIVVLGCGLLRATPEYGDTLSGASLARVRYGAKLAKQFALPVLVTGGRVYGGTAEAELMAAVLSDEFAVPTRWVESAARHTGENARFAARMLLAEGIDAVLLVTDEMHMRRALAHCQAAGLRCIGAPVTSLSSQRDSWVQSLPNADALRTSSQALHEVLGNLTAGWR
jgi:uncharacterized SAM-binding protein YcdF (DUF218 family)